MGRELVIKYAKNMIQDNNNNNSNNSNSRSSHTKK